MNGPPREQSESRTRHGSLAQVEWGVFTHTPKQVLKRSSPAKLNQTEQLPQLNQTHRSAQAAWPEQSPAPSVQTPNTSEVHSPCRYTTRHACTFVFAIQFPSLHTHAILLNFKSSLICSFRKFKRETYLTLPPLIQDLWSNLPKHFNYFVRTCLPCYSWAATIVSSDCPKEPATSQERPDPVSPGKARQVCGG